MSQDQQQSAKGQLSTLVIVVGILVFLCGGIASVTILAAIAIPNFVSMGVRAKRSELPTNLKLIKTAMIQYEAVFQNYVPCQDYPAEPSNTTQRWVVSESGGFEVIGWAPDGAVRGTYKVELSNNGKNFIITGVSDVAGDGEYATYVATKSENPVAPITPPDVY